MKKVIKLNEQNIRNIVKQVIKEMAGENFHYVCMAFLQNEEPEINEIIELAEEDKTEELKSLLGEFFESHYGDDAVEKGYPRIANYDSTIYEDNEWLVKYNSSIGGVMGIWYKMPGYYNDYSK